MQLLESFGIQYLQGSLPPWFYKVWLSDMTVPFFKNSLRNTVRPIGIKNQLVRTLHQEVISQNKQELINFLEPQQVVMSEAGGAKLVHSVRILSERNEGFVVVKIDMRNAFNEVSRAAIIEVMMNEPSLKHLAWHTAVVLAPAHGLEHGGKIWGEADEGETQGDPEAAPFFCLAWHPFVRVLDATLQQVGGMARFGMDDGYAVGPPEVVFPALERFTRDVREVCLLEWQRSKTEVFTWSGVLPAQTTPGLVRAGALVNGVFESGFLCYGVPIGADNYVRHMLEVKVEEVAREAELSVKVLETERQTLWTVLRASLAQRLDYWLQLCYPTDVLAAAERMDAILWNVLQVAAGSPIPRQAGNNGWECTLEVPVEGLGARSFQEWVVRQPVRLGGLGMRGQVDLSPAAFVGALEQALPGFGGEGGVCPQLGDLVGGGDVGYRWQPLLDSDCRTGRELTRAWCIMQQEDRECSDFLGQEQVGVLAVQVAGAGQGSTDGSTRKQIVERRDVLRGLVLARALEIHPNQQSSPVLVWPQMDKLSSAWLLSLPGPCTGMSSPVFAEAMCSHLCLPSPACGDRVGERVSRGAVVDLFGDKVMSATLPGDTWRTKHDKVKLEISRLCVWSRLQAMCEVFGLFAHHIPQEGLNRMERGRKRQAMVPDFRLSLPSPTEGTVTRLAELKVLNCCQSRYQVGSRDRAVDRRARLLSGEYRRKAKDVDRLYVGTPEGEVGPVQRKLEEYGDLQGLVVGAFGEGSEDLHHLVQVLAESRVVAVGLARGRPETEVEMGMVVGQIRRRMSVCIKKAQAECLLARLSLIGDGVVQADKRRQWVAKEDENMRRERAASWFCQYRGTRILRKGRFNFN